MSYHVTTEIPRKKSASVLIFFQVLCSSAKFFKMYTKTYQNSQQILYKMHIFDLMCEKEQQEQQEQQHFSRSMDLRFSRSKIKMTRRLQLQP